MRRPGPRACTALAAAALTMAVVGLALAVLHVVGGG
jgi:hypothetical protein